MRFPIIVLSYGDFADSMKLFFYEDEGIPLFPIFTNPDDANEFRIEMQKILYQLNDRRTLMVQICNSPRQAVDMLEVISSLTPELSTVIFDPSMSKTNNLLIGRNRKVPIKEVCQEFSELSS